MTDPIVASAVPSPAARQRRGTMVLADISGFTGFLQGVADAHIDLIVEAEEPPPVASEAGEPEPEEQL